MDLYLKKYQESRGKSTIGELFALSEDFLNENYTPENMVKAREIFNSKANSTYESLRGDYEKAKEILKSKTDNFTEEQKKEAEEKIVKLEKVLAPLDEFETYQLEKLREPIAKAARKARLNEQYEEKKEKK